MGSPLHRVECVPRRSRRPLRCSTCRRHYRTGKGGKERNGVAPSSTTPFLSFPLPFHPFPCSPRRRGGRPVVTPAPRWDCPSKVPRVCGVAAGGVVGSTPRQREWVVDVKVERIDSLVPLSSWSMAKKRQTRKRKPEILSPYLTTAMRTPQGSNTTRMGKVLGMPLLLRRLHRFPLSHFFRSRRRCRWSTADWAPPHRTLDHHSQKTNQRRRMMHRPWRRRRRRKTQKKIPQSGSAGECDSSSNTPSGRRTEPPRVTPRVCRREREAYCPRRKRKRRDDGRYPMGHLFWRGLPSPPFLLLRLLLLPHGQKGSPAPVVSRLPSRSGSSAWRMGHWNWLPFVFLSHPLRPARVWGMRGRRPFRWSPTYHLEGPMEVRWKGALPKRVAEGTRRKRNRTFTTTSRRKSSMVHHHHHHHRVWWKRKSPMDDGDHGGTTSAVRFHPTTSHRRNIVSRTTKGPLESRSKRGWRPCERRARYAKWCWTPQKI